MMLCLLFGCQKTQSKDGETTSSDCQTNDTAPYGENVESESNNDTAVEDFFKNDLYRDGNKWNNTVSILL